jgi:Tfp pilus assembly protein PilV
MAVGSHFIRRGGVDMKKISGFTLIEVLTASVVLVTAIVGTLILFTNSLSLTELSRNSTMASYEVEVKMEEILADDFDTIKAIWKSGGGLQETPFTLVNFNPGEASGTVYADDVRGAADQLMRIKVVVCYKQRNKIIGEDTNLNGRLDASEDKNLNGELDSPCQLETVIVNKQ